FKIKCAWELDGQKEPIPHLCSLVWMGRGVCGRTFTTYLTIKFMRIFIIFNGNQEILGWTWNPATGECDCDCIVMVIYGEYQQLAFTRPGYKAWVDITNTRKRYADIAFYQGKFYAVHFDGTLVVCRIDDNKKLKAKAVAPPPEGINLKIQIHIQKYIVESSGDLLFVTRFRGEGSIFKYKWVKVDSLGDQALFVGNSSSLSLTASSLNGIKPNCIYFTDDDLTHFNCTRNGGGFDMGVYRMEDARIMPHYSGQSLSFFCSPLWYIHKKRGRGGHFYSRINKYYEEYSDRKENESNDGDYEVDFEGEVSKDNSEDDVEEGSEFKYKWLKVDSLGDRALFVGDSSSFSLTS
ncbi:putative f-box protein, partial [Quercus suber]